METKLNTKLFRRTRLGYELTDVGAELFETVVRVEEELVEADRTIFGKDQTAAGGLRFTSTEIFVNGYIGTFIWSFLQHNPDIEISLVCTQSTLNLARGEADIAIRFTDAPPETLIGRKLTTIAYGIYAAVGPEGARFMPDDRTNWEWIGLHNEAYNRMLFGAFSPEGRPKHRADSMQAIHAMVRAGLGVAILPCYTADRDPDLRRLNRDPMRDQKFDMWLLYHPDARRAHRLRLFAKYISEQIKCDIDLFEGCRPQPSAK